MSQQLRQLKSRIRSIEGTWKVTRAMEMVSMSKFKASMTPLDMGRKYFRKAEALFSNLFEAEGDSGSPFLMPRTGKGAIGLLVVTTDAGLCGPYNHQATDIAEKFIKEHPDRPVKLYVYGRKGQTHFKKRGLPVEKGFPALHGRPVGNFHAMMLNALVEAYEKEQIEEVYVVYTCFHNAMRRDPTVKKFLPIEPAKGKEQDVIIEAGREGILPEIIPMYLSCQLRLMILESLASEHSARMVAMKGAKDNAKELMGDLVLLRNKMRQTMITREVIEIISSAEALKG
ncbi:MAG: ATP synthase F1 subunit gamma [Candidatus Omnitrophica bacterium]|nr:ATP synthase F1 subunit gamma [Candidatus Omnitrophota bacterium]